jgi:excisionase family DNA binding protein
MTVKEELQIMPRVPATKVAAADTTVEPGFITCKEAAAILKLSEISIRRFLTQKKLKRYKAGSRTLIRRSEVLAMIHEA